MRENLKVEMNLNDPFVGTSPNSWRICLHLGEEEKRAGPNKCQKWAIKYWSGGPVRFGLRGNHRIRSRADAGAYSTCHVVRNEKSAHYTERIIMTMNYFGHMPEGG